jgi:hypothetical protein
MTFLATLTLAVAIRPSFRAEQADFFFRFHSCERVGLCREKSLFVFLSSPCLTL